MYLLLILFCLNSFADLPLGLWSVPEDKFHFSPLEETIILPSHQELPEILKRAILQHQPPTLRESSSLQIQYLWDPGAQSMIQRLCDRYEDLFSLKLASNLKCRIITHFLPGAWALPTGEVLISAGLIGVMKTPDGILSVLGHELAHHLLNHHEKRWNEQKKVDEYNMMLKKLFKSLRLKVSNEKDQFFSLFDAVKNFHLREQEIEADKIGILSSIIVGAESKKVIQDWERFISIYEKLEIKKNFLEKNVLSTHPSGSKRIEMIKDIVTKYKKLNYYQKMNSLTDDSRAEYSFFHQKYKPTILRFINLQIKINKSLK